MSQAVLFIKLLLVHYATQSEMKIEAECNKNVSLKCPSVNFTNLNFLLVTWYKLSNNQKKLGIIRKGKGVEPAQRYNFTRTAWFGEEYSLFIPSVMPEDSGNYECAISANVGSKNLNLGVNLIVHECVTETKVTSRTTVLNTTHCQFQAQDLPVMWGIIGYVAVALTKVILCLISIRVISISSSRRQHRAWQK